LLPVAAHAEGDGGDGAEGGVGQQQLTSGSVLAARVDHGGDRVDQRIEDEEDSHAGRQGVGRHREDGGPSDGDDATGEEEVRLGQVLG
jgi:hypothetical protein